MWRTLDHTADAALEVEAASWQELLAEAAHAFGECPRFKFSSRTS
jgi:SHS2 domain-containing protein